ncbi:MAG: N-acetylmuramoyl-L-alanine amidase [Xanthomonadales bacterium]|nr:N-acetylmuramoyl-L-alanine amidase [Xanthomonadales bacterium]
MTIPVDKLLNLDRMRVELLPYDDRLERRELDQIQWLVVHCTELPDMAGARQLGEKILYPDSRTGNSGHFYVDRDGSIFQWVSLDRVAHHVSGFNRPSIGVELVNRGRFPNWWDTTSQQMTQPYPEEQVEAFLGLLDALCAALPGLGFIAGHEDLDRRMVTSTDNPNARVQRKMDPGPLFPWDLVLQRTRLRRNIPQDQPGPPAAQI